MRTMIAVAAVAVCAAGLAAQDKKQYEIDGRFTAKFPNGPTAATKTAGGLTLNVLTADHDKGKGGLLVTYSDIPADKLKAPTPEQVLLSCRDALKKDFMLKFPEDEEKKDRKVEVVKDGKNAKLDIEGSRDMLSLKGFIVLSGDRLYQVYAYGPKEYVTGEEAKAFLASFKIDDAPPKK